VDYSTYVTQIATMAVIPVTDSNYLTIVPQMINYAELRMQRDLDFLSTQTQNTSYNLSTSSNQLSIPTGSFVTLETIQLSSSGSPLLPVSKEYIQNVYPSNAVTGAPVVFAVYGGDASTAGLTSQIITVGPWPDSNYGLTLTGTIRSPTLSATNTTTFISVYLPDMFIMASMIYISAYQRNFGRQADDPAMAQSYEGQYQALLRSALVEENRKKYEAAAWTSYSPSPVATPGR